MDSILYWSIALVMIVSSWLQWYFGFSAILASGAWLCTFFVCIFLLKLTSKWAYSLVYVSNTWMEFQKIHWASVIETRSLAVSVTLMIAAFSVMLWLMDQMAIIFLTRWI